VPDVRLGLGIVNGFDPRDPQSLPMPLEVERPASRRVAVLADPPGGSTHPEIVAAVRRAADALAGAGYDVVEAVPPSYEEILETWGQWLFADIRAQEELLRMVMGPDGIRFLDLLDPLYPPLDPAGLFAAVVKRRQIHRSWSVFLADHPLILSPIWSQPPFPHSWDIESQANAAATMELLRPVMPANFLGLPAAAVPAGTAAGLPAGVQVMAERFQDLATLEAAAAIEEALGVATPVEPALATA
jgi:amidase